VATSSTVAQKKVFNDLCRKLGIFANYLVFPIVASLRARQDDLADYPGQTVGPRASKIDRMLDNCLEVLDHRLRRRWDRRV
jgi:hypothetical protein